MVALNVQTILCAAALLALTWVSPCHAANEGDAILGTWLTDDGGAQIEIVKSGDKYDGEIVWLKEPSYPKDDPEAGKATRDRENPDAAKRNQPMIGLCLLENFEYVGDNKWHKGTIYNPEHGKTYNANLSLPEPNKLKVRGYIGISLLGGSTVWTRQPPPGTEQKAPATPPKEQHK